MKRILCMALVVILTLTNCINAFATLAEADMGVDTPKFSKIYISYEEGGEYDWEKVIKARYVDTKEPITLSYVYSGRLYATVPESSANREIEAFETKEAEFTDDNNSLYEFVPMKRLSGTNVIKGNHKGQALPLENITRAEATAMLLRFLGLEEIQVQGTIRIFDDITSDKWYYREVLSAYNYGLVKGDLKNTFSPEREITREEFVVMAYRAAKIAGLGLPGDENIYADDKDEISLWAKEAYEGLGNYVESDVDNTDAENPKRVINPKTKATRYFVASLLYNLELRCQIYPSQIAEQFGFDKQMPVIDGSTSTYPFTEAVYGNLFSNGHLHPSKPQKHSKSHATYQKLINGEIDMSFASVYPASDILAMAKEKGVELELIPIAYDAMIFFTNKDNSAENLTTEQISDIYVNNAYSNWSEVGGPDALLYPYCRNNDSGSHAQMEKHFLNGNEIHPEVQKETSYTMSNVLTDVMKAKTDNPVGYGLGYSIYYYYHNMRWFYPVEEELKLLAIDGVMPTDETIANGSYPLSNNTYVVLRKDTPKDAPARKMAEFMLTPAGQQCVEQAGFGKLKTTQTEDEKIASLYELRETKLTEADKIKEIVNIANFSPYELQSVEMWDSEKRINVSFKVENRAEHRIIESRSLRKLAAILLSLVPEADSVGCYVFDNYANDINNLEESFGGNYTPRNDLNSISYFEKFTKDYIGNSTLSKENFNEYYKEVSKISHEEKLSDYLKQKYEFIGEDYEIVANSGIGAEFVVDAEFVSADTGDKISKMFGVNLEQYIGNTLIIHELVIRNFKTNEYKNYANLHYQDEDNAVIVTQKVVDLEEENNEIKDIIVALMKNN